MSHNFLPHLRPAKHLVVLPLPEALDDWLNGNYFTLFKDVVSPTYFQMGDVPSDQVLCTAQLSATKVSSDSWLAGRSSICSLVIQLHEDDFFEDIISYNLSLYVDVPESSGIDIALLCSPIVTLAHYEGCSSESDDAPKWTQMPTGVTFEFRQPRFGIAELFFKLALLKPNSENVSIFLSCHCYHKTHPNLKPFIMTEILNWASSARVSSLYDDYYRAAFDSGLLVGFAETSAATQNIQ